MNLDKELKAYDKKRTDLRNRFVSKVYNFIKTKKEEVSQTERIITDLEQKKAADNKTIDDAHTTLDNL